MSGKKVIGLCHRCEHRVKYIEEGLRPRCECGDLGTAKHSCYMYLPVKPVVLVQSDKEDKRPQFGSAMISSRSHAVAIAEVKLKLSEQQDGDVLYWAPEEVALSPRQ